MNKYLIFKETSMSSEQATSQIEVVEPTKGGEIKKYEKLYCKEKERNDILEKKNKYLLAKINILTNNKNKGEQDEVLLQLYLYHLNEMNQFDKLIEIFGEEASEGVSILNIDTDDEIVDINKLSKAPPGYKADCKIRMKKTGNIYYSSIKSKNCANPSIINPTSRSKFYSNSELNKYIPSLDILLCQYLDDPDNKNSHKSEVDRTLTDYKLNDTQKDDIARVIAYFMFKGTGTGFSKIQANSIIEYNNDKVIFRCCDTEYKKKSYVLENWDRYIISIRGHKKQKSGKIRGNGLKLGELEENDKKWVCYYIENGETFPRGAITIRLKT